MSPTTARTRRTVSGRVVLVVGALVGVVFVLSMYLGVLYDRATDPTPPGAASEASGAAPQR